MTDHLRHVVGQISDYLSDWATFHAAYRGTPGMQLAVRAGGELLVDTAWGAADLETGEAMTSEHLFRIASHSKTMTATAVMQLVQQDALRLDDPVSVHLPELAGSALAAVSVRELLGHQGGVIRDGSQADFWQRGGQFLDREQVLEVARREGDTYPVNTHFKYSNIGYSLLGLVIEAASGSSYAEFTRTRIVEPLGLTRTGPELDPARSGEYAGGHTGQTAAGDSRRLVPHVDTRAMAAATGWYSTAAELTAYGTAHQHGDTTLLSEASKRLLQREESRVRVRGREVGRYGLGFELRTVGERELVGHSGGYPGQITRTWIDPVQPLVVSCLTNAVDGPADAIATGVVQLINLAVELAGSDTPEVSSAQRFTGRFANLWGVTDIAHLGGRLVAVNPRLPDPAEAHQRLELRDGVVHVEAVPGFGAIGQPVEFDHDEQGRPSRVVLGGMSAWPLATYRQALSTPDPQQRLGTMAL